MRTVKVEGHEGLRKDPVTQAVINDNTDAFKLAVEMKERRLAEINRIKDLENKVDRLETLLNKLLEGETK